MVFKSNLMMSYSVQQLAKLAGVTVRTLHHYDQIGLLKPMLIERNGYRKYGQAELLKLQQILFFREMDFPLEEIAKIIGAPGFDIQSALTDQRQMLEIKKKRLNGLIKTIDRTIKSLNQEITMNDQDLYGAFSKDEMEAYAAEAKERWGNTDAYKQSQERVKKMGKEGLKKVMDEGNKISAQLAENMDKDPADPIVQALVAKHYQWLHAFYDPNLEMYRGLGEMYSADPRFAANYEKIKPGLAQFFTTAIKIYCDRQKG